MKTNRRQFLKATGLAGLGITAAPVATRAAPGGAGEASFKQTQPQRFNMHGYATPKLGTVRIGVIGLGSRGSGALRRLIRIEGAQITALADLKPEAITQALKAIKTHNPNPATYAGGEHEWKKLCERSDVDLVYICTPWALHTPQAVYAMEQGKHAASELPVALTIAQCWQLVETSERTRKHCIILGNQCFGAFELVTLNMARQGFFGDLVHGDGAYNRDLTPLKFRKDKTWFLERDIDRLGALYNIHGIGPIAQKMEINCGDSMEYLSAVTSNDFTMDRKVREMAAKDPFWQPWVGRKFNGNMTACIVRTRRGRTMTFQYDHFSAQAGTKMHVVVGTKAMAMMDPKPSRLFTTERNRWLTDAEFNAVVKQYTPEMSRRVGQSAETVGETTGYDHGGQDTIMDWRMIDCLRNGLPVEQNVYDAAAWSALVELTGWSARHRAASVDVPDFTGGSWQTNRPLMDLALKTGGTTRLI
ncbi:MAG: Gfo/Idh/MocA family oxidoreductase [Verrucomicrobia bacterium]|nr:Gfo/Idh/MocA family oxidoreductase [Verrucomicrobiota bacterium]